MTILKNKTPVSQLAFSSVTGTSLYAAYSEVASKSSHYLTTCSLPQPC